MSNITIDSQTFNLAYETLQAILDAMDATAKDGKEHGFKLCEAKGGVIQPGQICTGNECSIAFKDCKGIGPVIGSFHSHPEVISFSLADYMNALGEANDHPQNRNLTCVSLLDKGVRCKALIKMPTAKVLKSIKPIDTEEEREKIKPFFTPKLNVSVKQIIELLNGVPWEKLSPSEEVVAIDEGGESCAGTGKPPDYTPTGCAVNQQGQYPWPEEPTGQYPWSQKQQFKSVKGPMGIHMEPIPQPKILTATEFVDIKSIETPDPELIHMGEAKSYLGALSPVQLLKKKDAQGKYIIHDGRHRLVAWKLSGSKQVPVVFVEP